MYVAQMSFTLNESADADAASDLVNSLLGALRMNGQVCGCEFPITINDNSCLSVVLLPDIDALANEHMNEYVSSAHEALHAAGFEGPEITVIGADIDSVPPCTCQRPEAYILFTTYLSLESPLRCWTCFQPVPLYRIRPTKDKDYHAIICWQSDYQACDTLQMGCSTLERASVREMSRPDSSLSKRGRDICAVITENIGIPAYYYLYRYNARSRKQELARTCPVCNGEWRLDESQHIFDFKCDRCHLLSNIAWDVC